MKEIILYNHSGYENRGCEAIVRSTASLFAPYGKTVVFSNTPEIDRSAPSGSVSEVLDPVIPPVSLARLINSVGFRLGMPREQELARKYQPLIRRGSGQLCLSVGGDTYCYGEQEHMRIINRCLHKRGARLVLWGCSVDPELLEDGMVRDLSEYDLLVPRESLSAEALRAKGLPVHQWIDPAFTLPTESVQMPETWGERCVGINISPLVLDKSGSPEKTEEAAAELIRRLLSEGYRPVLIPHVTWAHDNDDALLSRLEARFGQNVIRIPPTLNAMQYKYIVSKMYALVTARTHLSIAAYSSAVPVLVIGYSVKARGIAKDIYGKEEGHLLQVQTLSGPRELTGAALALLERAEEERQFLKDRMQNYISGTEEILKTVTSL